MTTRSATADQPSYDLGLQEGIAQGLAAGQREGEILFLIRLLERRFGALPQELRERIHRAEQDQLLAWGERLLEAQELTQLFD
jgi:hypothetical protein